MDNRVWKLVLDMEELKFVHWNEDMAILDRKRLASPKRSCLHERGYEFLKVISNFCVHLGDRYESQHWLEEVICSRNPFWKRWKKSTEFVHLLGISARKRMKKNLLTGCMRCPSTIDCSHSMLDEVNNGAFGGCSYE